VDGLENSDGAGRGRMNMEQRVGERERERERWMDGRAAEDGLSAKKKR